MVKVRCNSCAASKEVNASSTDTISTIVSNASISHSCKIQGYKVRGEDKSGSDTIGDAKVITLVAANQQG